MRTTARQTRDNRTITIDFQNEATYVQLLNDGKAVVFQKWRWPFLHCPSKGIAVHKQTKDDVVHLRRF
jgi:hypothetical protein